MFKHPQHPLVTGYHLGIEAVSTARRRDRGELLQHPRPDPMPLKIIRDRKCDLRHPFLAQPIVTGYRHHPAPQAADQRQTINTSRARLGAGDAVRAAVAVEAKIPAVGRQTVIEPLDVAEVLPDGGLQAQRRPVPQQHITNERLSIHGRDGPHGVRAGIGPADCIGSTARA